MWIPKSLKAINIISFKNVEFEFRNGKAILVTGRNLDDSSQKINGSGKSSLIESIAIAYSGTSIRDVKTKELIHNGCDDGTVEHKLFNSQLNQELIIWRKIYANTKSAEYRAWINGVDQCELYSDFNTFNAWVWKTLGISKEDFFSFYLITSDNYEPYLKVGDTKKKEIINRFSGADKVDIVFPEIQKDSDTEGTELLQQEKKLLENTTKLDLLTSQLDEEKLMNSDEAKKEQITQKELELEIFISGDDVPKENDVTLTELALTQAKNDLSKFDDKRELELEPFNDAVELATLELQAFDEEKEVILQPFREAIESAKNDVEAFKFSKDYAADHKVLLDFKKAQELCITTKTAEIPKIKERFKDDIALITDEEDELNKTIKDTEALLKDSEKFESDVNKQLLDSITCPKCSHVFNLKDKEFNAEEAKAKLPEVVQEIADYKEIITLAKNEISTDIAKKKENINNEILKAGSVIREDIQKHNNNLVEIGQQEAELKKQEQKEKNDKQLLQDVVDGKKRDLDNKITSLDQERRPLAFKVTEEETNLKQKNTSLDNDKLTLTNQIKRCELNLQQKQRELKAHEDAVQSMKNQIELLKSQDLDDTKIKKLEVDISKLAEEGAGIKDKLELSRKKKEGIDAWEINFKSFKSHLANKSIKNIEDYTNLFLQNMGSNLQIDIDGYKTLASKKIKEQITTTVNRDGFPAGSYGKFSGGERGRIDISTILAIQELINLNSKYGGMDFLICDEIMDQVDVVGLESIINSIQVLGKTIMIISQNEINTDSEYTLVVQKENKVSTILN